MNRHNGHTMAVDLFICHPVEKLEPEITSHTAYREASLKFVNLLNAVFEHIGAALNRSHSPVDVQTAFWQAAYAAGSNICDGVSMTKRGDWLGIERATISKGATALCASVGLPPSFYMKSEEANIAYQRERIERVKRKCNKPKSRAA